MIETLERNKASIGILILCIVCAVVSFTLIASYTSSPDFMDPILRSLDEKKQDVLELTAAATGASVGITVLPGDIATPIAEKMANISQYLLVVMCAIYLEKYIMAIMGFITFKLIVPITMGMYAVSMLFGKGYWRSAAIKAMCFGLALFAVIPVSVHISDIISDSYKETVEAAIEATEAVEAEGMEEISQMQQAEGTAVEQAAGTVQQNTGTTGTVQQGTGTSQQGTGVVQQSTGTAQQGTDTAVQEEEEEKPSLWEKITGIPGAVAETVSEAAETAVTGASDVTQEKIEELQVQLNKFMESVAVMIITSCVIPILVLLFFVFMIKLVFGNWVVSK